MAGQNETGTGIERVPQQQLENTVNTWLEDHGIQPMDNSSTVNAGLSRMQFAQFVEFIDSRLAEFYTRPRSQEAGESQTIRREAGEVQHTPA